MQKVFSVCDAAKPEVLVIGEAADPTSRPTRKRGRRFLPADIEKEVIIVVPEVLPNRPRKKQILVARSTATKIITTLKAENEE